MAEQRSLDEVWASLQPLFEGLQAGNRLPPTAQLYDPRIDAVREQLRWSNIGRALDQAKRIGKDNAAAGYVATELIKAYCVDRGFSQDVPTASKQSADLLAKVEKQRRK